jgi:hypothetical protein
MPQLCKEEGCAKKNPTFDLPGGLGSYCKTHMAVGMVDVKHKSCEYEGCKTRRRYGEPGKSAQFCAKHKQAGMINMVEAHCEESGCFTSPRFGEPGKKARFCASHKKEGMIAINVRRCKYEGCARVDPCFGLAGKKGEFCATHKTDGMVDVSHKRCSFIGGCQVLDPSFGKKGDTKRYCSQHKTTEMLYLRRSGCASEGCNVTHPGFGYKGGKLKYCVSHKKDDMIDLLNTTTCISPSCSRRPTFGNEWRKPLYCKEHNTENLEDVMNIRCAADGCNVKNPNYGPKGGLGRWCITHKTPEMINVKSKLCEYTGCTKTSPAYDFPGKSKTGRFCSVHKEKGMIDIRNKRCEYEDYTCGKLATFGIDGGEKTRCKTHKTEDMIDVAQRNFCEEEGCKIRPNFGVKGTREGRFCATHKKDGMVDVKSNLCVNDRCDTRAIYGKPGLTPTKCSRHRMAGMIRRSKSYCLNCKEPAVWGANWVPNHCELHKMEHEINLVERNCSSCNYLYILDSENRCENCNPASFARVHLAKQNALMAYLDNRELVGQSTDIVIDGGICGKDRPDRVYDFGDKYVVLECDEDQHKGRACECEQTRMINIGQSFGGVPVYFIRWNPDTYKTRNSKSVPEILSKRHKLCGDLLHDIKEGKIKLPNALVSAIYLYYDNWSSITDEKWEIIAAFE